MAPGNHANNGSSAEELTTPDRFSYRTRLSIFLQYLQITAGNVSLSAFLEWVKVNKSQDTLWEFSLVEWHQTVSRAAKRAGRVLITDMPAALYQQDREAFRRARVAAGEVMDLAENEQMKLFRKAAIQFCAREITEYLGKPAANATPCPKPFMTSKRLRKEEIKAENITGNMGTMPSTNTESVKSKEPRRTTPLKKIEPLLTVSGKAKVDSAAENESNVADNTKIDGTMVNGQQETKADTTADNPREEEAKGVCCECKRTLSPQRPVKRMRTASAPSTAPAFPRRDPLESDVTFAFRLLNYLESTGAIEPTQNSMARKILSDELAKGLIASLMEFAIDKDITKSAAAVSVVAPRPAPLAEKAARNLAVAVGSELKSELKKKACRFFWDHGVPALMTVGAVYGTAALLKLKETILF